ncbi:hypothetical protein PAXINDRAFT_49091, partial [Paxillus involutus ATCC 200175]
LRVLKGHTNSIRGFGFFPDGRCLATGSWDRSVIIWDVNSGEVEKKLTGHTGRIRSVVMAPDGSVFASGSDDGTLRIWDGTSGNQIGEPIAMYPGNNRKASWLAVSFSPDSRRVAATRRGRVWIWDVQTKALVTGPLQTSGAVSESYTTCFSPDGSRIAADAGGRTIRVWDLISEKVIFDLKGHSSSHITWTAFTPDGRELLSASFDRIICRWELMGFWNLKTGNQKSRFLQHQAAVVCIALSPDGTLLATGDHEGTVYIWD